ncbi:MAG: LysM domain-containing protein [Planctomycetota bacterium]|nr:MAG: LysM domain-containing protein [Planctomycetota bacterium]
MNAGRRVGVHCGKEATMALNVKAALLTCLFVTGGACWLVNQVARPLVELPQPVGAATAAYFSRPASQVEERPPAPQFAFATPVEAQMPERAPFVPVATVSPVERVARVPTQDRLPPLVHHVADTSPMTTDEDWRAAQQAARATLVSQRAGASANQAGEREQVYTTSIAVVVDGNESSPNAQAETDEKASQTEYVVRSGDTLFGILRRHWRRADASAVQAIVAANPQIRDRLDRIRVGEVLVIPPPPAMDSPYVESGDVVAAAGSAPRRPASALRTYKVRKRDTLYRIAAHELNDGRLWRKIAELNGIRDADRIVPGTVILLPPPSDT